jgi:phosphatidate cytidylyltransferase
LDSASGDSAVSQTARPALSNLAQRVLSAAVLLPVLGMIVWLGDWWVFAVVLLCTMLALQELFAIFARTGTTPRPVGYLCAALFVLGTALSRGSPTMFTGLVLFVAIVAPLVGELNRRQREGILVAWALTLSGTVYIGWTFAHFVLLRQIQHALRPAPLAFLQLDAGAAWIFFVLLVTFANDSCAYLLGRAMGRHRMAPYVSPSKSWEGAVGGLLGAVMCGVALTHLLGLPIGVAEAGFLGLAGGVAGQAGDLAESLLKRQAGVKDSGHLIPGHGGILDRSDSLLFAGPTLYYLALWLTA